MRPIDISSLTSGSVPHIVIPGASANSRTSSICFRFLFRRCKTITPHNKIKNAASVIVASIYTFFPILDMTSVCVGTAVGLDEGIIEGTIVGIPDGNSVDSEVGNIVGICVGTSVGFDEGDIVGICVGTSVGFNDGISEGIIVGTPDGNSVGSEDGILEGFIVGIQVRTSVGFLVGI